MVAIEEVDRFLESSAWATIGVIGDQILLPSCHSTNLWTFVPYTGCYGIIGFLDGIGPGCRMGLAVTRFM
jgi:hypothetical protein